MALRTTLQLQTDFPNTTTAQVQAGIVKLDQLVRDGFLGDNVGEVKQILDWLGSYSDTKAETFSPALAVVGSAGSVLRTYMARPRYPLPLGGAGNSTALYTPDLGSNYENEAPGKPPQGRPNPFTFLQGGVVQDNRTSLMGKVQAGVDITGTPTTLIATDYVQVTAPSIGLVPNTVFDILVKEGETAQAFLFATTGSVSTSDSVVVNVKTAKGVTSLGPYTYTATSLESAANILAGVLAMLNALAVPAGVLAGWTFRTTGLYLVCEAPAADTTGDQISLNPTASTHILINGANSSTGLVAVIPAPAYNAIAFGVAPGAVVEDFGLARVPYDVLGEYLHAEVWVDSSNNPTFAFTTPNTTTANDMIALTFKTKEGLSSYGFTYAPGASATPATIVAGIIAAFGAENGAGGPLLGWTATSPTSGTIQFTSPDSIGTTPIQGGVVLNDSVTINVFNSKNVAVDALVCTNFTISTTGSVGTSDSIVCTFKTAAGATTVAFTIAATALETAAQLATAVAAGVAARNGLGQSLYGWTCQVFNNTTLLFSAPDAASDTVDLNPSAASHILINGSNSDTGATAVGLGTETKLAGPLLLERFSRVNVYESAGGAPATTFGGGASYVGPLT